MCSRKPIYASAVTAARCVCGSGGELRASRKEIRSENHVLRFFHGDVRSISVFALNSFVSPSSTVGRSTWTNVRRRKTRTPESKLSRGAFFAGEIVRVERVTREPRLARVTLSHRSAAPVVGDDRRREKRRTVWSVACTFVQHNQVVTRITDPQTGVAQDSLVTRAAMCVRLVDVRITCGLHDDAQLAAVFIDPRAK